MQKKPSINSNTTKKLGIEGMYLNIVKALYDKPIATSYLLVKN
jgi:hypothetical protein